MSDEVQTEWVAAPPPPGPNMAPSLTRSRGERWGLCAAVFIGGLLGSVSFMPSYGAEYVVPTDGLFLVWIISIVTLGAWNAKATRPAPYAVHGILATCGVFIFCFVFAHVIEITDYRSFGLGTENGCMAAPGSYDELRLSQTLVALGGHYYLALNFLDAAVLAPLIAALATATSVWQWNRPSPAPEPMVTTF